MDCSTLNEVLPWRVSSICTRKNTKNMNLVRGDELELRRRGYCAVKNCSTFLRNYRSDRNSLTWRVPNSIINSLILSLQPF